MSVKFEFYLGDKEYDLLMELKEKEGSRDYVTGNDYAKELLENKLYELKKEMKTKTHEK